VLHNFCKELLHDTFSPEKAFRFASRLEIYFTPKQGSWLNITEIELSAPGRQCLGTRRIPNLEALRDELEPWYRDRNSKQRNVDRQFATDDTRIKLKKLCPTLASILDVLGY